MINVAVVVFACHDCEATSCGKTVVTVANIGPVNVRIGKIGEENAPKIAVSALLVSGTDEDKAVARLIGATGANSLTDCTVEVAKSVAFVSLDIVEVVDDVVYVTTIIDIAFK